MENEIQKNEFILSGNIGYVFVDGIAHEIVKAEQNRMDGSTTVTIGRSIYDKYSDESLAEINELIKTEDAEFEIIQPKQLKHNE